MDELEDRLNKILKLYRQFQSDPSQEIAEDIELSIDMLKVLMGDQFYTLTFFSRIQREVTRWLDRKEMTAHEEEACGKCTDFNNPTVDKIGRKLGIVRTKRKEIINATQCEKSPNCQKNTRQ